MTCDARIKPFPNFTILDCEKEDTDHKAHASVLRDYAYPGSRTVIEWLEDDRRNFRGEWIKCPTEKCILPAGHPRACAF